LVAIGPRESEVVALAGTLKHRNPEVRGMAMQALTRIGPDAKAAVPQLIVALKADDSGTRLEAVKTLAAIGPAASDSTKALSDLLRDNRAEVGVEAARALCKLGDPKAGIPFLTNTLKQKIANQDVRLACVRILKEIGQPAASASQVLVGSLDEDGLRSEASAALAKMGNTAISPLLKKLVASTDAKTRLACVNTLGELASNEPLAAVAQREVLRGLQAVIQRDPSTENRDAAFRVVQQMQGKR
jgi:HEAT repeat protein